MWRQDHRKRSERITEVSERLMLKRKEEVFVRESVRACLPACLHACVRACVHGESGFEIESNWVGVVCKVRQTSERQSRRCRCELEGRGVTLWGGASELPAAYPYLIPPSLYKKQKYCLCLPVFISHENCPCLPVCISLSLYLAA